MTKATHEIRGLYTHWNLPRTEIAKLSLYELWRADRDTLKKYMYKTEQTGVYQAYNRYVLYKGNLYEAVFMNDSFHTFIHNDPKDAEFILSFRKGRIVDVEKRIVLIQRKYK